MNRANEENGNLIDMKNSQLIDCHKEAFGLIITVILLFFAIVIMVNMAWNKISTEISNWLLSRAVMTSEQQCKNLEATHQEIIADKDDQFKVSSRRPSARATGTVQTAGTGHEQSGTSGGEVGSGPVG